MLLFTKSVIAIKNYVTISVFFAIVSILGSLQLKTLF